MSAPVSLHIPRKRFGQHFLADRELVAAIVAAIAPRSSDSIVEIGPGLGALTRPLVERVDHLHVVEIDRDIAARLKNEFTRDKLTVHCADALRFDFAMLAKDNELRVAGNLPYNISTLLLFHLASYANVICDLHLMLQKEVVDRMVAAPSTSDYGRLSVMLQYRFAMEKLFDVPATAFRPPPKVESSFIRIRPLRDSKLPVVDQGLFEKIVLDAFSQRRKTVRNALKAHLTEADFAALGIVPRARAENLTLRDYLAIAGYLAKRNSRNELKPPASPAASG